MSENKRFNAVINEDNEIEYIQDLQAYEDLDFADFFELANNLSEQNKQLKKENKALKMELKRLYGAEEDDDDYDLWIKNK